MTCKCNLQKQRIITIQYEKGWLNKHIPHLWNRKEKKRAIVSTRCRPWKTTAVPTHHRAVQMGTRCVCVWGSCPSRATQRRVCICGFSVNCFQKMQIRYFVCTGLAYTTPAPKLTCDCAIRYCSVAKTGFLWFSTHCTQGLQIGKPRTQKHSTEVHFTNTSPFLNAKYPGPSQRATQHLHCTIKTSTEQKHLLKSLSSAPGPIADARHSQYSRNSLHS